MTSKVIENPVTGERIAFRKRAADTAGELLELDLFLAPGAFVATPHVHPNQTEVFRVVRGHVQVRVGKDLRTYGPGEVATVPPGKRHAWWNPFGDEAHLIVEVRPALGTETMFETFFGLAQDGKTMAGGLPRPLQLLVLLDAYRQETTMPAPVSWVLTPLVKVLAPLARLFGYRASYPRYSTRP
jgi:quercetin dioxygenase-like cupin family protein